MELEVREPAGGAVTLLGRGVVRIVPDGARSRVLSEVGRWWRPDGRSATFRDRARWRLDPEASALAIERPRPVPREPDVVVTLEASPGGGLASAAPHLCGADRYEVAVHPLARHGIELCWRISGPAKDLMVVRRYRPAAEPSPRAPIPEWAARRTPPPSRSPPAADGRTG